MADLLRALAALARARTSAEAPGRTGRSPLPSSFRAKRIRAISGSIGLARWQAGASRKRAKQVGQKRLLRRRVARTSCTGDHKAQIADTESGCKNNTLRTAWHCGNDSARTRGAMWFADLQAKRSCCQCTHTHTHGGEHLRKYTGARTKGTTAHVLRAEQQHTIMASGRCRLGAIVRTCSANAQTPPEYTDQAMETHMIWAEDWQSIQHTHTRCFRFRPSNG